MRSGQDYVEALRDGRAVYLDGELIPDVTTHPAYADYPCPCGSGFG